MMLVPEGQITITINDGFSGSRHVKAVSQNTTVESVLDDLDVPFEPTKVTLRLRNGLESRTINDTSHVFRNGDVLTISPSKQGAGC